MDVNVLFILLIVSNAVWFFVWLYILMTRSHHNEFDLSINRVSFSIEDLERQVLEIRDELQDHYKNEHGFNYIKKMVKVKVKKKPEPREDE